MRTKDQDFVIERSANLSRDAARQLSNIGALEGRELAETLDRIAKQLGEAVMLLENVEIEGAE